MSEPDFDKLAEEFLRDKCDGSYFKVDIFLSDEFRRVYEMGVEAGKDSVRVTKSEWALLLKMLEQTNASKERLAEIRKCFGLDGDR